MSAALASRKDETLAAVGREPAFVRLLGAPQVQLGDHCYALGGERRHVLLVYLAAGGQRVSRDRLASLLWPEHDQASARRNLRNVLFNARALPYCGALQVDPQGACWPVPTDLERLRRAVVERRWTPALEQCHGPLLDGFDLPPGLHDWLDAQRGAAHALWREAVLGALEAQADHAVEAAGQLLAHDGLDEPVVLSLCAALQRLHRAAEASRVAREFAARVRRELGVEPAAALQPFLDPACDARRRLGGTAALTPFFGRSAELRDIEELAAEPDCRLLSLVGAGGSGKTRLARHLAEHAIVPALWVALEAVDTGEAAGGVIARAIDPLAADAAATPAKLADALRDSARLLVLDNAEHLAAHLGPLIVHLLQHCPKLRILVTSRERLGVDGEWVMPVEGFACATSADDEGEAEQFFVACARRALPQFTLTAADRAFVHELAMLMAGNPLALELAAPWVRSLPLQEIVDELRRDIGLLDLQAQATAQRQRSLRASFEYSWRLLSQRERDALTRLAVFAGGFTREAVTHIAEVALPLLASLVDKCLLRYDGSGRYDRHPLIHQFTQHKLLADAALAARMRQRHAAHYLDLLEGAGLRSLPRRQRLLRLRVEWPNILRATEWFAERADWPALDRCSKLIANDPSIFGNLDVAANWAGRMLTLVESAPEPAPPALLARMLADRLWLQIFLELPQRAHEAAAAALRAARACGELQAQILVLRAMGHLARKGAQYAQAGSRFEQALRLARRHGFVVEEAMLLDALAMVENQTGDHATADNHACAALAINDRMGRHEQRMYNYYNIGEARRLAGRVDEALPWLEQCVALAREIEFEQFLAYALVALADLRLARQEADVAWCCASDALAAAQALDDPTATSLARVCLARVLLEHGGFALTRCELHAALTTALRWSDAAVVVVALPVAARLCLKRERAREAGRWLRWLCAHPARGAAASQEARSLLAACGTPDDADAEQALPDDPLLLGREIVVALA